MPAHLIGTLFKQLSFAMKDDNLHEHLYLKIAFMKANLISELKKVSKLTAIA